MINRVSVSLQPHLLRSISVYLMEAAGFGGVIRLAKPVVLEAITPEMETQVIDPTFSMNMEAGQQLMDELWRCGLRPTDGTGSAGSLAATERHLADMRALVFKTKP